MSAFKGQRRYIITHKGRRIGFCYGDTQGEAYERALKRWYGQGEIEVRLPNPCAQPAPLRTWTDITKP